MAVSQNKCIHPSIHPVNTYTQQRFLSIEQGVIHSIGRLEGLAGTTRYDLPAALREELKEVADCLRDLVRDSAKQKSVDVPN
jgi:hypothetical protein